ncbi:MAG: hypothetical protein UH241_03350 [Acutalibacteraceae bacterium]|nr:hypothetical protein [Acutalibacteraceae bacterium]
MSERAKFFNRRSGDAVGKYTYSAEDFAEFFNTFFSDGVVGTGLRVSTSSMGVVVNSGYAIISGHWYNNDSSLTLLNPSVITTKRKDSIAIKLDKSERTITAVWVTGSADSYPVLVDDSDIKYIKLADIELLAGGVIKAVYDKRPYCHALYTLSLDEFNEHWDNFLRVCNNNYNQYVRKSTATSELIKARGGYDVLSSRLSIIDYLLELLFESATDNLFDKERALLGELDNKGSIDNSITNSFTTDYISINDGMTLYFWDRNGNPVMPETTEWYSNKSADGLIKYINYSEDTSAVNDCHAKYIRLSFNNTIVNADNLQITLSNKAPTSYTEFAYKIKEQLKQIQSNTAMITKLNTNAMEYITENVSMSLNDIYTISATAIASNSPVSINVAGGGGNTMLVRADGLKLLDRLTGNVIDNTMTQVEITADDVRVGVRLTEGGTLTVSYYNKRCEDLLSRLASNFITTINNGVKEQDATPAITTTTYEEVEI